MYVCMTLCVCVYLCERCVFRSALYVRVSEKERYFVAAVLRFEIVRCLFTGCL